MQYADHRSRIRSGDLLAWSHRGGWFDSWHSFKIRTVRLFTMSEYSHVGIALVMGGRVWVLEAVTPLVRMVPLSGCLPCYHVTTNATMTAKARDYALSFVGNKQYEYSQAEAALAAMGKNTRDNGAIQCCEYANLVLTACGVNLQGKDTPTDLVKSALDRGGKLTQLTAC